MSNMSPFKFIGSYGLPAGVAPASVTVKNAGEERQVVIQTPVGSDTIYVTFDGSTPSNTFSSTVSSTIPILGGAVYIFTMLANQTSIGFYCPTNTVNGWALVGVGE
jgi:hypothetical protein